uniref:Uncharacterized protein n=1 Tax=Ralstonia solanacearum TaxID=305 RepID=A0A0S4TX52_RALSL|nr:protein of unknown function [Ralstonia solanacearum]
MRAKAVIADKGYDSDAFGLHSLRQAR